MDGTHHVTRPATITYPVPDARPGSAGIEADLDMATLAVCDGCYCAVPRGVLDLHRLGCTQTLNAA
jgi:hypothetical protein